MKLSEYRVAVIGAGNLAWSLIPNLQRAGVDVQQLISRDRERLLTYADTYGIPHTAHRPEELRPEINLLFLTVSDQAIEPLAARLPAGERTVLHCSGSMPLSTRAAAGPATGVCYPLQIFTRQAVTDFSGLPLFLEATAAARPALERVAHALSPRVYELDSAQRLKLHLGAVWVCNFPNLLYRFAEEQQTEGTGLDIRVYEPLIRMHIDKVFREGPANSQTGPAIRGDMPTLHKHLQLLQDQPAWQELYRILSQLINPELFI
jgi:predicted short-subunit dehydrogenase-like oxidoreductase (DUF2520 family)